MPTLAAHCRKHAVEAPCGKDASKAADGDCKGLTGNSRANCMNARYELRLAEFCADVVCPGDPNRYLDQGVSATAKTSTSKAGGFFSQELDQFTMSQGVPTATNSGGGGSTSVEKTRMYIFGGIAVLVVLAMTTYYKKTS